MLTLGDLLKAMFPHGTRIPEVFGRPGRGAKAKAADYGAPSWPPDLFAICAKLLELSGAYHHVTPSEPAIDAAGVRRVPFGEKERGDAVRAGQEWWNSWTSSADVLIPQPEHLLNLWNQLTRDLKKPIYRTLTAYEDAPRWWSIAVQLLVIADEGSKQLGFGREPGTPRNIAVLDRILGFITLVEGDEKGGFGDNCFSISFANRNVACILPKSRTPRVGCTVRSLSHHLALLPPQGEVRARWFNGPDRDKGPAIRDPLKILVVPFPYEIDDTCFKATGGPTARGEGWGWFEVVPEWLGSVPERKARAIEFSAFVKQLVIEASASGPPVGAVVLPEVALDQAFCDELVNMLMNETSVELLVNGTSEAPTRRSTVPQNISRRFAVPDELRQGNFVSQTLFFEAGSGRQFLRSVREKHHRWRLDRSQIQRYDLSRQLDPDFLWWERLEITGRSLDLMSFRSDASFTSLICEDLARVDPCQAAVRAIGPTLVVSLLMDGSQLSNRWPARYASVLSEDPGSSVLTVTSLALIRRTAPRGGVPPKRSIGLWSDALSGVRELVLDDGAHAVCFSVQPKYEKEATLEGRSDNDEALVWEIDMKDAPRSVTAATPPAWLRST